MRVISKQRLREFWSGRKDKRDVKIAQEELMGWFKAMRIGQFRSFANLKQTYPSADQVGNCTVFDIANNRYRLIGRVMYGIQRVYVLAVLTHAEYDRQPWVETCGCHRPSPTAPRKGSHGH